MDEDQVSLQSREESDNNGKYKEVKTFLEGTDIKDKIEMNFIDLKRMIIPNGYEDEMKIVEKRSEHPITFIEGKPAFVGDIIK